MTADLLSRTPPLRGVLQLKVLYGFSSAFSVQREGISVESRGVLLRYLAGGSGRIEDLLEHLTRCVNPGSCFAVDARNFPNV